MRTKKRQPDYGAISRSSIKKDFQRVQRYPAEEKRPQIEELPKINAERRIIHISEVSGYAKFARYIVGKLVRLKEKANVGGNSWYCEFVHDDDRKAPDFKEFDNGGCVATFSLATTKRGFTTKDGRQIPERTEWHNIVLQNGLAKVANQYVKKGDKLYIEGELRTRSYDDAQGVKRYITEIVATDMEMLTPKGTGPGTQAPPPPVPDAPAPTETTIYHFKPLTIWER